MVGGSKDSIACHSTCQVGTVTHAVSFGASVETTVVRNHLVRCYTGWGISAGRQVPPPMRSTATTPYIALRD